MVPSPQFILRLMTVPSGSEEEIVRVMGRPLNAVEADSVKLTVGFTSVTVTTRVAECDSDPVVPVTLIV